MNQFEKIGVEYEGKQFDSLTDLATYLGKTVSAVSKYKSIHGQYELVDSPTKDFLRSGVLGQQYESIKQARQELGITEEWPVFMQRVNRGVPVKSAKSPEDYKQYKKDFQKRKGLKFKDPVVIQGKTFEYYMDIVNEFECKIGKVASPQTIRKRRRAGVKDLDLIIDKTHIAKV